MCAKQTKREGFAADSQSFDKKTSRCFLASVKSGKDRSHVSWQKHNRARSIIRSRWRRSGDAVKLVAPVYKIYTSWRADGPLLAWRETQTSLRKKRSFHWKPQSQKAVNKWSKAFLEMTWESRLCWYQPDKWTTQTETLCDETVRFWLWLLTSYAV